jgi:hypothetical protein
VENLMHVDRCKFAVEEIQELISNFGINCGPIDGRPGEQFERGVVEFRNMNKVFPMSKDWRDLNFIYRLVEETIRNERQGSDKIR